MVENTWKDAWNRVEQDKARKFQLISPSLVLKTKLTQDQYSFTRN